jgi:hypothetical protein
VFTDSKTTAASFQVVVTKGITVGITASVQVGVPDFGTATISSSVSMSLSTAETQGSTLSQTWSWNSTIPVPPHSHVKATIIVQEAKYSTPFTAKVRIRGAFGWVYITGHEDYEVWYDCGALFRKYPHPEVVVIDDHTIECVVSGVFSGVQGVNYVVETSQIVDGATTQVSQQPPFFVLTELL